MGATANAILKQRVQHGFDIMSSEHSKSCGLSWEDYEDHWKERLELE